MAGPNVTTFNKLLAVKAGGGNPGAPGINDVLNLELGLVSLTSDLQILDGGLSVAWSATNVLNIAQSNAFIGKPDDPSAYTFTVAALLNATEDAHFSATGGTAQAPDFLVDGYAKLAGFVEIGGSASIAGNLSVAGTLTTVDSQEVLLADRFISLNANNTTVALTTAGLTFNVNATNTATVTAMDATAGTITLAAYSPAFAAGDIIVVAGLPVADAENNAPYVVGSYANDVIIISTSHSVAWAKTKIPSDTSSSGSVAVVQMGVLNVDGSSGKLQWASGSAVADFNTYADVPYNGYMGYQGWKQDGGNASPVFSISAYDDTQVFVVSAGAIPDKQGVDLTGFLHLYKGVDLYQGVDEFNVVNTNYAISLQATTSNGAAAPGVDKGALYSKVETTNTDDIAELFYYSAGVSGNVPPVQITKNGALNIDALTFSLQEAYNDGNSIETSAAEGGALTLTAAQGYTGNVLDVTGPSEMTGTLTVDNATNADRVFSVDGVDNNAFVKISHPLTQGTGAALYVEDANQIPRFAVLRDGGAFNLPENLDAAFKVVSGIEGNATRLLFEVHQNDSQLGDFASFHADLTVFVEGTLDLNGSVDADVSAFDLLSSGDVSIKASGILSLKGPVAANLAETASASIALGDLVMMTANGLAPAFATSQNVIALGVALAAINANASSEGLVADFGSVEINAEQNLNLAIAAGQRLYLSAATAGAVTNAEPSAAGSSVFQVGVALTGDVNGKVKVALRPQFMYNVF